MSCRCRTIVIFFGDEAKARLAFQNPQKMGVDKWWTGLDGGLLSACFLPPMLLLANTGMKKIKTKWGDMVVWRDIPVSSLY